MDRDAAPGERVADRHSDFRPKPRQERGRRLDQRDGVAATVERLGHFQADVSAADDRDDDAGLETALQRLRVGERTERQDRRRALLDRDVRRDRPRAGRKQDAVEGLDDLLSRFKRPGPHARGREVDLVHAAAHP